VGVCNALGLASGARRVGDESQAVQVGLDWWRSQAVGVWGSALLLLIDNDKRDAFFELANFSTVCHHHDWSGVFEDVCKELWRVSELEDQEGTSSTQSRKTCNDVVSTSRKKDAD
jgi:hypothetical protein